MNILLRYLHRAVRKLQKHVFTDMKSERERRFFTRGATGLSKRARLHVCLWTYMDPLWTHLIQSLLWEPGSQEDMNLSTSWGTRTAMRRSRGEACVSGYFTNWSQPEGPDCGRPGSERVRTSIWRLYGGLWFQTLSAFLSNRLTVTASAFSIPPSNIYTSGV